MPLTKIDTGAIKDNAINSAKIADGTVVASDVLDNTITGAKLASDIAISTSGNITTTGALTSTGIDDNATSTAITIDSSQKVGIGTTSPQGRLHILTSNGGVLSSNYLLIEGSPLQNDRYPGIQLKGGTFATTYPEVALGNGGLALNLKNGYSVTYPQRSEITASNSGIILRTSSTGTASERMRIDSSGNVGIGISTPVANLEVRNETDNDHTDNIKITNSGWGDSIGYLKNLSWGDPNTLASIGSEFDGSKVNMHFHSFYNGGYTTETTKLMTILGNGNVGIGTTSPATKLQVSGNLPGNNLALRVTNTATDGYSAIQMRDDNAGLYRLGSGVSAYGGANSLNLLTVSSHNLTLGTSNQVRMLINGSGNVGIGTSSPNNILEVSKSNAGSETSIIIRNQNGVNTLGNKAELFLANTNSLSHGAKITADFVGTPLADHETDLIFYTTNPSSTLGERMRIDGSGNVGIGTSSPSTRLHVSTPGSSGTEIAARFSSASDAVGAKIERNGSNWRIAAQANLLLGADYDSNNVNADSNIIFETEATERMRIDSSGKVLVGTTTADGILTLSNAGQDTQTLLTTEDTGGSGAHSHITLKNTTGVVGSILTTSDNLEFRVADATVFANTVGTEHMRIDNSGNVGIGTISPSPYNLYVKDNSGTSTIRAESSDNYIIDMQATSGTGTIRTTGSYPLVLNTNQTERMRITGGGNVGIGTSAPTENLEVVDTATNIPKIRIQTSDGGNKRLDLYVEGSHGYVTARQSAQNLNFDATANLIFNNTGAESMRINSSGSVGIGTTSPGHAFTLEKGIAGDLISDLRATDSTNPYGIRIIFTNGNPDNNTNYFIAGNSSVGTKFFIYSDGDIKNHDNSYGAISDERIKQDIRDSNSQWNDIKNIRVRNFKKKDDVRQYGENAWEQIGVVAQELETVSPKLIKHSDPTPSDILSDSSFGTLYEEGDEIPEGKNIGDVKEIHQQVKGVSYSVLYMKSIKALQEAMERIETLEAKVQTLENNQP